MKKLLIPLVALFALGLYTASAQQPASDSISIDENACLVNVEWSDGRADATKLTLSVNGVLKSTIALEDEVGDQSQILASLTLKDGDVLRATLYGVDGPDAGTADDVLDVDDESVSCPATATPVNTATPASTATPAPTQTPVIIIVPAPTFTPVPTIAPAVIRPPTTGSGGLLD